MPELPEVETICRGLRPLVIDRVVEKILYSDKELRRPVPRSAMDDKLVHHRIVEIRRRAKYLLVQFDSGVLLVIHLGMTGNLGIFPPDTLPARHCHVRFQLSDGMELRFTDTRRFGAIYLLSAVEAADLENTFFQNTGPEPFSDAFNADYLRRLAKSRSLPVKSMLMNNQVVAGIGNIYANESLFVAGIAPGRRAADITSPAVEKTGRCHQRGTPPRHRLRGVNDQRLRQCQPGEWLFSDKFPGLWPTRTPLPSMRDAD